MKIIDKINDKLKEGNVFYSFEYFPPKTQSGIQNLVERVDRMANNLNPLFVDMTWGAGGKTAEGTLFLSSYIQNYLQQDVLMHITCRAQTKEKLDTALESAQHNNIKNLLVLRGDPPAGQEDYDWSKDPFQYAEDMIKYIREKYGDYFGICVAGYPSTHIESKDKETDLYYLKRKVDCGADFIITQLFYDADEFIQFKKDCENYGIKIPILPGILPVNNYKSFKKIIDLCKLSVPKKMIDEIEVIKHDEEKIKEFGIRTTIEMCNKLIENGIKNFHFYTMNLEKSTTEVINRMNIKMKGTGKDLPWKARKMASFKSSSSKENLQKMDKYTPSPKRQTNNNDYFNDKEFIKETVRPIFWANNSTSYISKTFYWDEFPNGVWGDSRSPAFGNNEEHLHTFGEQYRILNQTKNDSIKKTLGNVTTYEDISKIFVGFLEGKIKKIPWGELGDIKEETSHIQELLLKMNSKCFLTINSQPFVNGVKSSDPIYGWGPSDNGYIYQKMYIEFFIQKEQLDKLIPKISGNETILYQAINCKGESFDNLNKQNVVCALTWGVFPNREIIQPTVYDSEIFSVWKDEAFEKFDEWARAYNLKEELPSKEFLKKAKESFYLMTIVDNDYISPTINKILMDFLN